MDKKYMIATLIKKDHKYGDDKYILGRISGVGYILAGKKKFYAMIETNKGMIYQNEFTPEKYDEFINVIDNLYPGLIVPNYKVESK